MIRHSEVETRAKVVGSFKYVFLTLHIVGLPWVVHGWCGTFLAQIVFHHNLETWLLIISESAPIQCFDSHLQNFCWIKQYTMCKIAHFARQMTISAIFFIVDFLKDRKIKKQLTRTRLTIAVHMFFRNPFTSRISSVVWCFAIPVLVGLRIKNRLRFFYFK